MAPLGLPVDSLGLVLMEERPAVSSEFARLVELGAVAVVVEYIDLSLCRWH